MEDTSNGNNQEMNESVSLLVTEISLYHNFSSDYPLVLLSFEILKECGIFFSKMPPVVIQVATQLYNINSMLEHRAKRRNIYITGDFKSATLIISIIDITQYNYQLSSLHYSSIHLTFYGVLGNNLLSNEQTR